MAGAAEFHGGFWEKLVRQVEDVVSLPEGRQGDSEFVETVVDILAKPARPHLALERNIGGGDDPHVHGDWPLAAERLHLSFLQRTQQLCLGRKGKVDNLIEEEASARGELELPGLSLMGTGERALLIAEELRLDQGVRDRAAVDGDKRILASGTELMDRPRDEFLAGAGLALDEDCERRVGHLPDLLDNLLHLSSRAHQPPQRALDDLMCLPQVARALLDDGLELVEVALERHLLLPDPATQRTCLNRPAQRHDEVIPVDRLLDEVIGPTAERVYHQVVLGVPGDHQGGRVGPARPDLGQQLEAVHPRHLDVGHDRVVVAGRDPIEGSRCRVGRVHHHLAHSEPEGLGKRLQQGQVVVDDEHPSLAHGVPLADVASNSRPSLSAICFSSLAQRARADCRSFTRRLSACARIVRRNAATKSSRSIGFWMKSQAPPRRA